MATEPHDIATTFLSGLNLTEFQRDLVDWLTTTGGMTKYDARAFAGFTTLTDGELASGQAFAAGTLNIGIGDGSESVTAAQRLSIDGAIAMQTGQEFSGPTLSTIEAGELPGEQAYIFDGLRTVPIQGVGSWCYWDGAGNWRYMHDHTIAATP